MQIFNIPNTLTILRIMIIPVFVTAIVYSRYTYALYLFSAAALTDMLDGLLARVANQKTVLGTFLDPLADKILLVTSFVIFASYGWLPKWFAIAVISRDLIVTIGWLLLYITTGNSRVRPAVLGKIAVASQLLALAYILLGMSIPGILPPVPDAVFFLIAAATAVSGLRYIFEGLKLANAF